jgi:hypothetical protein
MHTKKWDVILCSLVEVCQHSREMVCYVTSIKCTVVSRITSLLAGRFCVNLRRDKRISSSLSGRNWPRVPRNFLLNAWWRIFHYDKAAESETDLSHTFSAGIENENLPYGLMAWFEKLFFYVTQVKAWSKSLPNENSFQNWYSLTITGTSRFHYRTAHEGA